MIFVIILGAKALQRGIKYKSINKSTTKRSNNNIIMHLNNFKKLKKKFFRKKT